MRARQHALAEFDFRLNMRNVNDCQRTALGILGISGKRLYYRNYSGCLPL